MVDQIRGHRAQEMGGHLERAEVIDALKKGDVSIPDILKNLPANVSTKDILSYLRDQWRGYKSQVLQDEEVYSLQGDYPSPSAAVMPPAHDNDAQMSQDEGREFAQSAMKAMSLDQGKGKAKAMVTKALASDTPLSEGEVMASAEGHVDELDNFMFNVMDEVIDRQMIASMEDKLEKTKLEVMSILEKVKRGELPPEYAIIALLKVHQAKNGSLMAWTGKKMKQKNEEMNRVTQDLSASGGRDFAQMTVAQQKTKEGTFEMQLLSADLQKLTQDSATVFDHCKSMISMIQRSRQDIISRGSPA